MATQPEIIQDVAEDLNLVPIGQDPESQDVDKISVAYNRVYSKLKEKGLAVWASTADVPDSLAHYFKLLVEVQLLTTYSVPDSRFQRIILEAGPDGSLALTKLGEMAIPEYTPVEEAQDF